ncbi:phosphoadenosine phosphosulfate reductase family protein [Paludicola sp. MB14-C6]|uniref:phosphoadenosine phosphosulfate reductase domain-containing protein n=1 Tax=Paludihabitans sp. MB14-C6 TaxID=3070656 RepID=UPI0027DE90F6|nr:phosphoadenosine phosphosulfate reductase family protein [Paludicola sp. MB14-C6]WMJ22909.1 phosphoadenosine phosphosulfate reductase family protein [Paludicola sp. MB14-C6]
MWCKNCNRETNENSCELCGNATEQDIPVWVYWCDHCKTPIIKEANRVDRNVCPLCNGETKYMSADIRPVFPEERLLLEILVAKPLAYKNATVWVSDNRYYIDGVAKIIPISLFKKQNVNNITALLEEYKEQNDYSFFNEMITKFVQANSQRLNYLIDESVQFIKTTAEKFPSENIVVSFSGGKDSTVAADLTVRALSNPSLVHIFGDTTLEFPLTMEYAKRFRENNPKAIFKVAKNKEQDFYSVCEDIGPPARMLRWCCSMFKTGPITRVLNSLYRDTDILTFYGIRKCESVSRSKYNRVEDSAESVKIQKQTVASPIFLWKDIDIWLYMLGENVDFNDAYRLGYDRVGCWCCPNNNERAQFLSKIYMPEQAAKWREFLIGFAKKVGKPDPEVYIDSGKWKARQGGNGVLAAEDVKIRFTNCTAEDNAKVYKLSRPLDDSFICLFTPFGKISKELGRKMINETIVLDMKTNVPIISIQPFNQGDFKFSVKVKTMNVVKHDDLQRMIGYQIRKYNACRKCLKCESLCKFGAISIIGDEYRINDSKCKRCKMCVTAKYLDGGCMMDKYLKTKE